MSDPIVSTSLLGIANEIVSGLSSLHMQNEEGKWLDEVEPWVRHAKQHFHVALRALYDYMTIQDQERTKAYAKEAAIRVSRKAVV